MAENRTDVKQSRQQEDQTRQEEQSRQRQQEDQGRQRQQGNQSRQQGQSPQESRMTRREPSLFMNPFAALQRLATEMTGVFDDFGLGRGPIASKSGRGQSRSQSSDTTPGLTAWVPDVDVFHRGNDLVVRADLPGLSPDDVVVEVSQDAITISGERRQEHEEERGEIYRFERTYGAFFRVIPLPEGAFVEQAKASFKDGVLEISVPAPPEQASRGRRLEISQGSEEKSEKKHG
jgi:HSP20 family protein